MLNVLPESEKQHFRKKERGEGARSAPRSALSQALMDEFMCKLVYGRKKPSKL
jgi:hypothetical protein